MPVMIDLSGQSKSISIFVTQYSLRSVEMSRCPTFMSFADTIFSFKGIDFCGLVITTCGGYVLPLSVGISVVEIF